MFLPWQTRGMNFDDYIYWMLTALNLEQAGDEEKAKSSRPWSKVVGGETDRDLHLTGTAITTLCVGRNSWASMHPVIYATPIRLSNLPPPLRGAYYWLQFYVTHQTHDEEVEWAKRLQKNIRLHVTSWFVLLWLTEDILTQKTLSDFKLSHFKGRAKDILNIHNSAALHPKMLFGMKGRKRNFQFVSWKENICKIHF